MYCEQEAGQKYRENFEKSLKNFKRNLNSRKNEEKKK